MDWSEPLSELKIIESLTKRAEFYFVVKYLRLKSKASCKVERLRSLLSLALSPVDINRSIILGHVLASVRNVKMCHPI